MICSNNYYHQSYTKVQSEIIVRFILNMGIIQVSKMSPTKYLHARSNLRSCNGLYDLLDSTSLLFLLVQNFSPLSPNSVLLTPSESRATPDRAFFACMVFKSFTYLFFSESQFLVLFLHSSHQHDFLCTININSIPFSTPAIPFFCNFLCYL